MNQKLTLLASAMAAVFAAPNAAQAGTDTGPSSSDTPYVVNVPADVHVVSVLAHLCVPETGAASSPARNAATRCST